MINGSEHQPKLFPHHSKTIMLRFISLLPFSLHFSNLSDLHKEINTSPPEPLIESVYIDDYSPPASAALSHSLLNSDGIFFIRYTSEGTHKSRWFLVQLNHEETQV